MTRRALVGAALVFGCCAETAYAAAPRVVLIDGRDADGRRGRLRAELEGVGLEVVDAPPTTADPTATEIERTLGSAGALGGLRLRGSGDGVDVWVLDRRTGKLAMSEAVLYRSGARDEELVALRAVELLRASLLEVAQRATVPPPSPSAAVSIPRVSVRRWAATLGVVGSISGGGVDPMLQLRLTADWIVHPRVRIGLAATAPTAPGVVRDSTGTASLSAAFFVASLGVEVTPPTAPITFRVGADVGAAWLHTSGDGAPGFAGVAADVAQFLVGAHAQASRALGRGTFLFVEVAAMIGTPQLELSFNGRSVASYGTPIGMLIIGLGYER